MPPIGQRIKEAGRKRPPLWKGPEVDGITFSMLSRFLVCRERFRVAYVEGLQPPPHFNHRTEYGNLWHTCEEAYHAGIDWREALIKAGIGLGAKYSLTSPTVGADIEKWCKVCAAQFEVYINLDGGKWATDNGMPSGAKCVFTEKVFDQPLELPSGRTVRLRGKWDGVWMVYGSKRSKAPAYGVLQENKTKGDIQPEQLRRQLTFDLQTMIYIVAMDEAGYLPRQLLYNIVRRPLSGGRHSIVQKKGSKNVPAETPEEYYERLRGLIESDPEYFFMRWNVPIEAADIERFKQRTLYPVLEQLCAWYEWVTTGPGPFDTHWQRGEDSGALHWQHPFGVYNILDEGGATDYDAYLTDGNPTGLQRVEALFPELQE